MTAVAIDLGESGGWWFVADQDGSLGDKEIRSAILNLLGEQYTTANDWDYVTQVEELATAELIYKTGWWATDHIEGEWVEDEDPPEKVSGWFVN